MHAATPAPNDDRSPSSTQRHLDRVLRVDALGSGRFIGRCPDEAFDRMYGGQPAAQSVIAAARTARDGQVPLSIHTNFLRLGRAGVEIEYEVVELSSGRSVAVRAVTARQGERTLTTSTVVFQNAGPVEIPALDYSAASPVVPGPENLPSREASMRAQFGEATTQMMNMPSWPAEIRYIDRTPWDTRPAAPSNRMWLRSKAGIGPDQTAQRAALVYLTDLLVSEPVWYPGPLTWEQVVHSRGAWAATLDYSMYFHRDVDLEDWVLLEHEALAIAGSHARTTGRFWDRQRQLLATVTATVYIAVDPGAL